MANLTKYIESEGSKTLEVQARIEKYRKQFNISQSKMAEMINVPRSTYAYLEKRATKLSIYFVEQVAVALGIPTNLLWNGEAEPDFKRIHEPILTPRKPLDNITLTNSERKIIEKYRLLPLDARKEIRELVDDLYLKRKIKNNE